MFHPGSKFVIRPERLQTNCDWSPYDGWKLTGYPAMTFSRGRLVARSGKFVGTVGAGKFVERAPWGAIEGRIAR